MELAQVMTMDEARAFLSPTRVPLTATAVRSYVRVGVTANGRLDAPVKLRCVRMVRGMKFLMSDLEAFLAVINGRNVTMTKDAEEDAGPMGPMGRMDRRCQRNVDGRSDRRARGVIVVDGRQYPAGRKSRSA